MIILASASPRRQELLRQARCSFKVAVSDVAEEDRQDIPPAELVIRNAAAKASAVWKFGAGEAVLGADTVVALEGRIYGKPADREDAIRMLSELSGKAHEVYTGIAFIKDGKMYTDVERTAVTFAALEPAEIEWYVDTKEPLDKAGAYGIQGAAAMFIEKIDGCYSNVVGLPLYKLRQLSKKAGIDLS